MDLKEFFESLSDRLQSSAHVKTIYGEPISTEGKTVVPVAKIAYGFGGGSGKKTGETPEKDTGQEGTGGGAGIRATPVGVVEITARDTRFIPFGQTQKIIAALLVGYLLGRIFWRRHD